MPGPTRAWVSSITFERPNATWVGASATKPLTQTANVVMDLQSAFGSLRAFSLA
jgi:hypothetical protein